MIKRDELPGKPDALSLFGAWLYNTTKVKCWTISTVLLVVVMWFLFPLASVGALKLFAYLPGLLGIHAPDVLGLAFVAGATGFVICVVTHTAAVALTGTLMKWAGWKIITRKR